MPIDHRAEAERHLDTAVRHLTEVPADMRIAEVAAAIGQGHATLARNEEVAATAADMNEALQSLRRRFNDTRTLVSKHIADGLASREKDRWKAANNLTKALDEAHCNMDSLIDAHLADDGWDPRSAYKVPADESGWTGYAAEKEAERDPWASAPDITTSIPEPIRRVLAGHLAEMLLNQSEDEARKWARGITFELKREGLDLGDAIKKRITDLTLGADPSDPPF
ncbi:hypothetical protein OG384_04625 [Streptomyces sp. NBC_01324]|uniref:hypothetical protein n=1 Tax=Streptomyces sp. NBC_01324 TaxID=2903826 RepID=UPI002E106996|nr:hypothetical protein OG384_04625 [Streptomyces sp. NBC_01324]